MIPVVLKLKLKKGEGKKANPPSWADSERSPCSVASGTAAAGRQRASQPSMFEICALFILIHSCLLFLLLSDVRRSVALAAASEEPV